MILKRNFLIFRDKDNKPVVLMPNFTLQKWIKNNL